MGRLQIADSKEYNRNYYLTHKQWYKDYAKKNHKKIKAYVANNRIKFREYVRQWKLRNLESYRTASQKSKINKRIFFWGLKQKPCVDCKMRYFPVAMDFDHLPKYKKLAINGLTAMSKERLLLEIKKCELVCANCHRIRTWKRRNDIN